MKHTVTANDRSSQVVKKGTSGRGGGGVSGVRKNLGNIVHTNKPPVHSRWKKGKLVNLVEQLKLNLVGAGVSVGKIGSLYVGKDSYDRIMKKAIHKAANKIAARRKHNAGL